MLISSGVAGAVDGEGASSRGDGRGVGLVTAGGNCELEPTLAPDVISGSSIGGAAQDASRMKDAASALNTDKAVARLIKGSASTYMDST